jgi:hypothetical protein
LGWVGADKDNQNLNFLPPCLRINDLAPLKDI